MVLLEKSEHIYDFELLFLKAAISSGFDFAFTCKNRGIKFGIVKFLKQYKNPHVF